MDRAAPDFAWPEATDPMYSDLAGFLARLNEMSLDEVTGLARANGQSAVHELEVGDGALSDEADEQWGRVFADNRLDEGENADMAVVTITYCLGHGDGRRVVVAYNRERRRMFPLWWDPDHKVSGSDGLSRGPSTCAPECLHNP